jgi:hypothetical protein
MKLLSIFTALCLIVSLIVNPQKTRAGIKKGAVMFLKLLQVKGQLQLIVKRLR